eukprot:2680065-Ditylum_brightwellii.AAC.1
MPAPGGDPIQNTGDLPTGCNMHTLDLFAIPTTTAVEISEKVMEKLLEKLAQENDGVFSESIAFTLWGTDNIRIYGESLAQVLALVGLCTMTGGEGDDDVLFNHAGSMLELGKIALSCKDIVKEGIECVEKAVHK